METRKLQRHFFGIALGSLFLISTLAPVDFARADGDVRFPWSDSTQYQECGVGCTYQKINENYSLQARFISYRLEGLEKALAAKKDGDVLADLGSFCAPSETNGKMKGAQACFDRFKANQVRVLEEIRAGIVSASTQLEALKTEREGTSVNGRLTEDPAPALKAQQVYVPTAQDLQVQYDSDERLNQVVSQRYVEWLQAMPWQPKPDEFWKIKQVPRNPGDPNSEMLSVVETNWKGNPVHDEKAFKVAMKEYDAKWKDWDTNKSQTKSELVALAKNNLPFKAVPLPRDVSAFKARTAAISEDAYAKARWELLQVAKSAAQKLGLSNRIEVQKQGVGALGGVQPATLVRQGALARAGNAAGRVASGAGGVQPGSAPTQGARGPANVLPPPVVGDAALLSLNKVPSSNGKNPIAPGTSQEMENGVLAVDATTNTPTQIHVGLKADTLNEDIGDLSGDKGRMVEVKAAIQP